MLHKLKKYKNQLICILGIAFSLILILSQNIRKNENTKSNKTYDFYSEYTTETENKIKELIEKIDGVSNVNIMVMLKNKNINNKGQGAEYVMSDNDDFESLPEIQGVAVVCKGGSNAKIQNEITKVITSALGLRSTQVYVTE